MRALDRLRDAWTLLTGQRYWLPSQSSIGWSGDTMPGSWQKGLDNVASPLVLTFSVVYACVAIISGDVAKLGCSVYRRGDDGASTEATTHPLYRLLQRPNDYQTSVDFWQSWMISTLLAGNAYIFVQYDNRMVPVQWHVLDPRAVSVLVSEDGSVFYRCNMNYLAGVDSQGLVLTQRDMIHHRMMCLAHPLVGVTPLYASANAAMLGAAMMSNSKTFFSNASRPSGVLTAPGKIDKETATRLKSDWEENTRSGNIGRVSVLGSGLEWRPLTINATDAQLIEQLRYTIEDVARAFRVPGFMLGDLTKVTYKNSEQLSRTYYSGCLQYHLESIEDRIDNFFALSRDLEVEFDIEALLRTDMDVRYSAYQQALNSSWMALNEVRKKEGLPRLEGGDEPMVQMQYRPLSQAVKEPPEPTAPGGSSPPPPNDEPAAPPADEPVDEAFDAFVQALGDEASQHAMVISALSAEAPRGDPTPVAA